MGLLFRLDQVWGLKVEPLSLVQATDRLQTFTLHPSTFNLSTSKLTLHRTPKANNLGQKATQSRSTFNLQPWPKGHAIAFNLHNSDSLTNPLIGDYVFTKEAGVF
ncbi:hypothetical protein [Moorena sp. SIOASIH]|uniref:hypothetical protein n=1 Tax=Moorena sp. SIOASIH TaxID=2607817 RepID=UPI0025DF29AC|nr:hypothetical protein [Moorena sp. SIOASIH]